MSILLTVYLIIGIGAAIWGYSCYAEGGVPLSKLTFSVLVGVFWFAFLFLIIQEEINIRRGK